MDTVKCTRHASFAAISHPEETSLVDCQRPVHFALLDGEAKVTDFACKAARRLVEKTTRVEVIRCKLCGGFLAHTIGDVYTGETCATCIAAPPLPPAPKVDPEQIMNDLLDMVLAKAKMCGEGECPKLATRAYFGAKSPLRCEDHALDGEATEITQAAEVVSYWPLVVRRAMLAKR